MSGHMGHENRSFEYGGYHFMPVRQFTKSEGDFFAISKRLYSDFSLGLSTYAWRTFPYSYEGFYAASTDKACDIFRCAETGRIYVPGQNELFGYNEPPQRRKSVPRYNSGADMWREYKEQYGNTEAHGICNRYLDLQVRTSDAEELQFCRELFAAMQEDLRTPPRSSILNQLEKAKAERTAPAADHAEKPDRGSKGGER